MPDEKGYGAPSYQYIDGTTAAEVTTVATKLYGAIVQNLDSGTVTIGNAATTIVALPTTGSHDFHGIVLDDGLKVTTSTDGQVLVIYSSL